MQMKDLKYWKKRVERLDTLNQFSREKLSILKKEKKEFQRALRYRDDLFHSIPDALILIQEEKIVDINKMALDQLGYKAEEMIGLEFLTFVHPTMRSFAVDLQKKMFSGRKVPDRFEMDLVGKNGGSSFCEVRFGKAKFDGRKAFLLSFNPIDKRKKKEKERIQSKKMEALTTMASGLARQFSRSLKDIIVNTVKMRDMTGSENGAFKKGLSNIEYAASRLFKTTRGLDSFSRAKNDPSDLVLFDLKKIVKEAIALTDPRLKSEDENHGVKINLKTYLRSVSPIEGDPNAIRDVIANLILNAVDAMPNGGDLYLTTEENASHVFIYIQDSGLGVADTVKERIFDPCFTANGRDGMGLGLSLSYAIIKRHHGEIDISSENGHGTVTSIMLPCASGDPRPKTGPMKRKVKNAHILIIEDDDMIRELLSQLLGSKGFRVDTTDNGLDGLYKLKRKSFHMVIADSKAPGVEGQVLMKKMKKINHDLPFALIVHHEPGDKPRPTKKPTADMVITKPIDMNKLVQQVSELIMQQG
jgi:PAS domain S-box-containing protein